MPQRRERTAAEAPVEVRTYHAPLYLMDPLRDSPGPGALRASEPLGRRTSQDIPPVHGGDPDAGGAPRSRDGKRP
jgi:hypothetical protein